MNKNLIWVFLFLGIIFLTLGFKLQLQNSNNFNPKFGINENKNPSVTISPPPTVPIEDKTDGILITNVLDGDTVETSAGEKIRYLGINAPEKGQPYSSDSTNFNKSLVLNKNVRFEYDVQLKDRYDRTLAYVFVEDKFVNLEMIKNGLAVSETIPPNVKYQDEIVKAQEFARNNCLGIWKGLCEENNTLGVKDSCVKIASIKADAPGDDNKNKNGEWIEIKNDCQKDVNLKGWLIKDNSASNKYFFGDFSLNSGRIVIIYSGCGKDDNNKLYWQCPEGKYAIWNNSGDNAFIYNDKGSLIDDYKY